MYKGADSDLRALSCCALRCSSYGSGLTSNATKRRRCGLLVAFVCNGEDEVACQSSFATAGAEDLPWSNLALMGAKMFDIYDMKGK